MKELECKVCIGIVQGSLSLTREDWKLSMYRILSQHIYHIRVAPAFYSDVHCSTIYYGELILCI